MRQEQSGFDSPDGVIDEGRELLALLLGDRGPQILHFDQALADKDNLCDLVDTCHPRIADELGIECGDTSRLFWISGGGGLPFQETRCTVELTNCVNVGDEAVARTEGSIELNLLGWNEGEEYKRGHPGRSVRATGCLVAACDPRCHCRSR